MGKVKTLTRTTATSAKAIGSRVAACVEDYLPEIIDRVVEVDRGSSLAINIIVKPAGRTEAAKDPEVVITCTPKYGAEAITIKARITGEGDDAQLSLIQDFVAATDEEEEEPEAEEPKAATG